jgi:hypothetical protein
MYIRYQVEKSLEKLIVCALLFLLNHIARYKTRLYNQIIDSREPITFIRKALEVSETKFPKLILDQLTEQYFLFTSSSY